MTLRETFTEFHTRFGNFVEARMSTMGPNTKYAVDIFLRIPMLFLVHQWLILAPSSDYIILEVPLIVARIFGAASFLGCMELKMKYIFIIYSTFIIDVMAAWTMEFAYWLIQNEARGTCENNSRLPVRLEDIWWTLLVVIGLVQIAYVVYLDYRYHFSEESGIKLCWVLFVYLFLHVLCSFGCILYILAPIYYYFYKLLILGCCWLKIMILVGFDERFLQMNNQGFRSLLPDKWIMRDIFVSFAVFNFCSCLFIDSIWLGTNEVLTIQYAKSFIGSWTTSSITLISLSTFLGFLSNCAVAVSRYIVIGSVNVREVFDVNVGARVYISTITLSIQAGILTGPLYYRTDSMAFLLLLVLFIIVCQMWDLTEQHFLFLLNSGESRKWLAYLRVISFLVVIVTGPTFIAYQLAPFFQYDLWPFLNITGVTMLVSRCAASLVEYSLVAVSWRIADTNDRLADLIYYIRIFKSMLHVVCMTLHLYYKVNSPYFTHNFLTTLLLSLTDFFILVSAISIHEWKSFQKRRRLVKQMDTIPNSTPDQIAQHTEECSICYDSIASGKTLPCGHMFHTECIRKWFQVKPTCPYCNTDVHINLPGDK